MYSCVILTACPGGLFWTMWDLSPRLPRHPLDVQPHLFTFFFFKSGSSSISNSLKNFLLFIGWIPKFLAEGTRHLHAEKLAQVAILISHRPLTRNLFSSRRKHCSRIHSGYFHFIYLCMGFFSIWKVSFLCPWNFPASFSRFKMRSVTSGKFLWPPEVELDVSFLFTAKARSFYL